MINPVRPLRPRAEGEMVWQPEKRSLFTPQFPDTSAEGNSVRELGQFGPIQILVAKRFTTQTS